MYVFVKILFRILFCIDFILEDKDIDIRDIMFLIE